MLESTAVPYRIDSDSTKCHCPPRCSRMRGNKTANHHGLASKQMAEFARAVCKSTREGKGRRSKLLQSDLEHWGLSNVTLRPYQCEGVSWLAGCLEHGHGCILGDEMGLGKTVQVRPRTSRRDTCAVRSPPLARKRGASYPRSSVSHTPLQLHTL